MDMFYKGNSMSHDIFSPHRERHKKISPSLSLCANKAGKIEKVKFLIVNRCILQVSHSEVRKIVSTLTRFFLPQTLTHTHTQNNIFCNRDGKTQVIYCTINVTHYCTQSLTFVNLRRY
jgi:hypothetical protein